MATYKNVFQYKNGCSQLSPPLSNDSKNENIEECAIPLQKKRNAVSSVLSPVAEGVQRKVSSIDQMAQFNSYYDVKGMGSQGDSEIFMEEVERRKSVLGTFLLPMMVSSGFIANTVNKVTDQVVRSISVVNPESQLIPEYKLENTVLPPFVLLHFGRLRLIWDWTILLLVAYLAILLPFNVAFKSHHNLRPFFVADFCLEFIFITDILLNFRTTYIDAKTGRLVTKPKSIAMNYMKHWFALDFVATLPFDIVYFINNDLADAVAILKLTRLLRLFRIGRRVSRSIEYTATLLVLMMFSFALLSHWLACVWYVIGYEELNDGVKTGWLIKLGDQINKPYFENNTNSGPSYSEEYISALYFIFTSLTTVGFGNISPNTVAEKTFSVIVLLLGAMVQSAIFGNMTAVIQKLYASRARFHAKASQIKQFVHHHQIDGDLRKRIEDWFISHWSVSNGVNTEEMLESFPSELQADICLHLYRRFLTLPCFSHASRGCLRSISSKVKKANFSPGELIIKEKDAINTLFFVQRGTVEIVQKDFIVAILGTGDLFGEDICKSSSNRRSNGDVKALMYCEILYLSRDNIKEVTRFYSDFADLFSQSVRLTFDLGANTNTSNGLGSIVEENEHQTSTSSEESEDDLPKKKNRKFKLSNTQQTLPLWQIKSMQNELRNSPSPSLKYRLSKLEDSSTSSTISDSGGVIDSDVVFIENDNKADDVTDAIIVDVSLEAKENPETSYMPLNTFADDDTNYQRNFVTRARADKWTPTRFRRNRYAMTYFANRESCDEKNKTPVYFRDTEEAETKFQVILDQSNPVIANVNTISQNHKHRVARRQSSSSLPDEYLKTSSKTNRKQSPKSRSFRMRRRKSSHVHNYSPFVYDSKQNTVNGDENNNIECRYYNDEGESRPSRITTSIGNAHVDTPLGTSPSIVIYSDFEGSHDVGIDTPISESFLKGQNLSYTDLDQGIYSQCSGMSAYNENDLPRESNNNENLTKWINQVNKFASNTLEADKSGEKDLELQPKHTQNVHSMKDEICTLRNEMKELKTGMLALTELVRLSIQSNCQDLSGDDATV